MFEEWSFNSPQTPNVRFKDDWDLCLMNTSKPLQMLIIEFLKLLFWFLLTQLVHLRQSSLIKMDHLEVFLRLLTKPNLQLFLKVLMMTIMLLKLHMNNDPSSGIPFL